MKGIWKYSDLLPKMAERAKLTLGEGNTPIVRSRFIGPSLGLDNLYFKLENLNPSGSYKDRFASMAVSRLLEENAGICLATSSGNTGAALAAFCAAAGIPCAIGVVDGAPSGKLLQMQAYGASTLMVKGFGKEPKITDQVMALLQSIAQEHGTNVQISAFCYCPEAMQGVQTIAYEIAEALDQAVQVFVPAGGGGLTLAIAEGFRKWQDFYAKGWSSTINCVQPLGNDTIASSLASGKASAIQVAQSLTSISGLQVPNVLDGDAVIAACRESGGRGISVSDREIFNCQEWLAQKEGIYCEPAGALALAGVCRAMRENTIGKQEPIVCIVSGHGFKDPTSTQSMAEKAANVYLNNTEELQNYIVQLIK